MSPTPLRVGGIITVSAGVGVVILAFLLQQVAAEAFWPVLGGGIVTLCVGGGLMVAARAVEQQRARAAANQADGNGLTEKRGT